MHSDNIFRFSHISSFSGYTNFINFIKIKEATMKAAYKDKHIPTVPESAWESGTLNKKEQPSGKEHLNDITTDIQGNGYPISRKKQGDQK